MDRVVLRRLQSSVVSASRTWDRNSATSWLNRQLAPYEHLEGSPVRATAVHTCAALACGEEGGRVRRREGQKEGGTEGGRNRGTDGQMERGTEGCRVG